MFNKITVPQNIYIYGTDDKPVIKLCREKALSMGLKEVGAPVIADLAIAPLLTQKLSQPELFAPALGTLVFHPSLLPRHRGPDAIKWAYANQEKYTGVTWFWADDGLDTGDIAEREVLAIHNGEKARDFYLRAVVPVAVNTLERILALLSMGIQRRIPQNHQDATYEPKIKRNS